VDNQPHIKVESDLSPPASFAPAINPFTCNSPASSGHRASLSPSKTSPSPLLSNLELVALGLPAIGARTRVETQLKLSLVLVQLGERVDKASLVTESGDLADDIGDKAARVGSWAWLKLPKWSAIKRNTRRHYRHGAPYI
jgi:hypothetical protein